MLKRRARLVWKFMSEVGLVMSTGAPFPMLPVPMYSSMGVGVPGSEEAPALMKEVRKLVRIAGEMGAKLDMGLSDGRIAVTAQSVSWQRICKSTSIGLKVQLVVTRVLLERSE